MKGPMNPQLTFPPGTLYHEPSWGRPRSWKWQNESFMRRCWGALVQLSLIERSLAPARQLPSCQTAHMACTQSYALQQWTFCHPGASAAPNEALQSVRWIDLAAVVSLSVWRSATYNCGCRCTFSRTSATATTATSTARRSSATTATVTRSRRSPSTPLPLASATAAGASLLQNFLDSHRMDSDWTVLVAGLTPISDDTS